MNAELSDKAGKPRREKSETAFKHSAHPNERRGHAACDQSHTVARLTHTTCVRTSLTAFKSKKLIIPLNQNSSCIYALT